MAGENGASVTNGAGEKTCTGMKVSKEGKEEALLGEERVVDGVGTGDGDLRRWPFRKISSRRLALDGLPVRSFGF